MQTGRRLDLGKLGERLKSERGKRGLSLQELADRAGVSRSMISAIERGTKAATVPSSVRNVVLRSLTSSSAKRSP